MPVTSVKQRGSKVTIEVEIDLAGSLFEMEGHIEEAVNAVGCAAMERALQSFDADGSTITMGDVTWWSKGLVNQKYQTSYGCVNVERHLYQTKEGGRTFCPLESDGRIILTSTPRFAKSVASKYAQSGAGQVARDFEENHGRPVSSTYVKSLVDVIGAVAQKKEESWTYAVPALEEEVVTIAASMDGTCMLTCETGWREAMVGCFSLYAHSGERLHTIYLGATPEYGKETFYGRFDKELASLRKAFPEATVAGIADGAQSNWSHLTPLTDCQVLDFYHVSEYVSEAANVLFAAKAAQGEKRQWLEDRLHKLKHDSRGVQHLLSHLHKRRQEIRGKENLKTYDKVIAYITNNKERMAYAQYRENGIPIGSGVCEAACKTLVKQRLCNSGMRWKEAGASAVIALRALQQTQSRWQQFWEKVLQYGI